MAPRLPGFHSQTWLSHDGEKQLIPRGRQLSSGGREQLILRDYQLTHGGRKQLLLSAGGLFPSHGF